MERNVKLDNLKAFLIFTVVYGHALEFLCGTNGIYGIIRSIIYSFHMPTFIFLSGYFSKYSKKHPQTITVIYLFSYLFFNSLYALTPWRVKSPLDFLHPQLIYWYLLTLLYWRICTPVLSKIKFIVPISLILTLYIGCFVEADRFLSISRAVCFFPFFLVGYFCQIDKIYHFNKRILILLLSICLLLTVYANYSGLIPIKMYEYIQSYYSTDVTISSGIIMRSFMMLISFIMIVCLIGLAPSKTSIITSLGKNSLMIYLLHLFIIKIVSQFFTFDPSTPVLNICILLVMSVLICFLLGMNSLTATYNQIIKHIVKTFVED